MLRLLPKIRVSSLTPSAARSRRLLLIGALGAAALGAGACAVDPASEGDVEIGAGAEEIRGGRARDDHPEIAKLWMKDYDGWFLCTATLVDRKIAITAGHCVNYENQDKPGTYGYLDVQTKAADGHLATHRYTVNGYHNFDGFPQLPKYDPDDIGLVRLAKEVPCSVAHPAGLRKDSPKAGTVVSRWGYGVCGHEPARKRMRHFTRGGFTNMLCDGDSGGPTLDPAGKVYQINSGSVHGPFGLSKDTVARVEKEWNGITRVMDEWGRAGRCP